MTSPFPHGAFCWTELATTDVAAAKKFYGELLGWKAEDMPMPGNASESYTIAKLDGQDVCGLHAQRAEEKSAGMPPHWSTHVAVNDVDETFRTATGLGAKGIAPPFDIPDVGRMAVLQDPTGAFFNVWKRDSKHAGAGVTGKPGSMCWNELLTKNVDQAVPFYTKLFGWSAKASPEYTEFHLGERGIGGTMTLPKEAAGAPSHWMVYFAVSDCDRAAETVKRNGGRVLVGPQEVAEAGRFAVMQDPQGATFAVIKLNRAM